MIIKATLLSVFTNLRIDQRFFIKRGLKTCLDIEKYFINSQIVNKCCKTIPNCRERSQNKGLS